MTELCYDCEFYCGGVCKNRKSDLYEEIVFGGKGCNLHEHRHNFNDALTESFNKIREEQRKEDEKEINHLKRIIRNIIKHSMVLDSLTVAEARVALMEMGMTEEEARNFLSNY